HYPRRSNIPMSSFLEDGSDSECLAKRPTVTWTIAALYDLVHTNEQARFAKVFYFGWPWGFSRDSFAVNKSSTGNSPIRVLLGPLLPINRVPTCPAVAISS